MKFDYNKTLKYATEYLGEKENECTYEYLYQLSKTTGYAFWDLRCELKNFAQPLIDVCNKIYSWFPKKKKTKIVVALDYPIHYYSSQENINKGIVDFNKVYEQKKKQHLQYLEQRLKEKNEKWKN